MSLTLAQLPPEVLGPIINDAQSNFLVLMLLRCGNRLLNSKLCSAATCFEARAFYQWLPATYPRLISELRNLRSLALYSNRNMMKRPQDWQTELSKLPEGLEKLSICTEDDNFALLNFAPDWTEADPKYLTTNYELGSSKYFDMRRFYRMHTLSITAVDPDDLAGLPPSLTVLNSGKLLIHGTQSGFMATLPRNLRRLELEIWLHLRCMMTIAEDWKHAPPHLAHIKHVKWDSSGGPSDAAWLPRTMTSVSVDHPLCPEQARSLPPLCENLSSHVSNLYDTDVELPSTLKKLAMTSFYKEVGPLLLRLPSSLTALKVQEAIITWPFIINQVMDRLKCQNRTDAEVRKMVPEFWPPHLTSLKLLAKIDLENLYILPQTLRCLTIWVTLPQSKAGKMSHHLALPSRLTSLNLAFYGAPENGVCSGSLPPDLTTLAMSHLDPGQRFDWPELWTTLPVPLREFRVYMTLEGPNMPLKSNLQLFFINEWRFEWLKLLPRSLRHFETRNLFGLENCALATEGDFTVDLPPQLLTLRAIRVRSKGKIIFSPQTFASLQHLEDLHFIAMFGSFIPSATIRVLSRHLRKLQLRLCELDENDAPFLPPLLTVCNLQQKTLLPDQISARYWPFRTDHIRMEEAFVKRALASFCNA